MINRDKIYLHIAVTAGSLIPANGLSQFNAGMFVKPSIAIVGNDTNGRKYSDNSYAASCKDYKNGGYYTGDTGDGVYWIKPSDSAFKVYCEMTTNGGGWTLIAKISGTDSVDRWGYDQLIYKDSTTLGDATNLNAADAKSTAYSAVAGTQILIRRLNLTAYAVHTYSATPLTWGQFLTTNWTQCGLQISAAAIVLLDDGRDSIIGNGLYLHHYDGYDATCSSQERAMLSEYRLHPAGWNECGVGALASEPGVSYVDAISYPAGSINVSANLTAIAEDYAFLVR
ncbi:MAG: hypothetical protein FJ146_17445 [Deltaproteobacteria bacterium]|nr:hypothetical protein [Deltaproteobacteria bacterium]